MCIHCIHRVIPLNFGDMAMLKLLLTTSVVAACMMSSTAFAERLLVNGSDLNKTVACTNNNISINGKNNTVKLTGKCDKIDIRGNGHNVIFETSEEIEIKGANNKVTGGTSDEISVTVSSFTLAVLE